MVHFQQGNAHTLYRSITEQIFMLPDSCLLYHAHDYTGRDVTSVAEERDFVGYMETLRLPHPRRLAEALPANLRSGKPHNGGVPPEVDDWAPIERSYAGLPQLKPRWVADHREAITLVDVRSAEEYHGPEGHIAGSRLIPLPELQARLEEIPADRPAVILCHSGSRSALATQQLIQAGRQRVANLRGGLRTWQREGLPIGQPGPEPTDR